MYVDILRNVGFFRGVEEVGCAGEYTCTDRSEDEMPADKEYGVFEVESIIDVVIVDNDTGAKHDPDRNNDCGSWLKLGTTYSDAGHLAGL